MEAKYTVVNGQEHAAMTTKWEKFCLLMWKNWLLQWRHKVQTLFEVLMPALFSALVVMIRSLVDPDVYTDSTIFKPLSLSSLRDVTKVPEFKLKFLKEFNDRLKKADIAISYEVVFSPDNEVIRGLVEKARKFVFDFPLISFFLSGDVVVGVSNATELEKYMVNKNPLVGLEFDDNYSNITELPDILKYAIRLPGELRTQFGPMWANWRTDFLFPFIQAGGARNHQYDDGGVPPGYYRESFLTLQNSIFQAYSSIRSENESLKIPEIFMRRFPYPPFVQDPLLQGLERMLSIFILLSFVYPFINMVKFITTEKEKQLKESMKIMGLPNWLHWTAWFCKCFIYLLFATGIMLLLLKAPWYPNMDVTVFTNSGWTVLWFFLLVYSVATITFVFMLSVFFSKANTAAAVGGLLWFVSYVPFSFLIQKYDMVTLTQKLIASLFSNAGMGFGTLLILRHEGAGSGLQWSNLFEPINVDDDFTVGHTVVMMSIASIFYLGIALYVEQIFPGDYGVPEPWYFPLLWFKPHAPQNGSRLSPFEGENPIQGQEPEPPGRYAGIETKNLRKVYGNHKEAVKGLTLNMYEDQITVLLGHNGAGKTTTMSMLTGMIPPTSGTALVNGLDLRGNINDIRGSLGLCPQHNVLFDELTVAEHIEFFGRLKGLAKSEVDSEIKRYVELLQFEEKIHAQSKTLSGGMKRKLSIGIALCANSKVVLCDEPTSGVDPSARRALWDLLIAEKKGRTILLSTHFMDEADILGDRIAIMSNGDLKAVGSSFYLKKNFGVGYRLVCVKGKRCDSQKVTEALRKYVASIRVETNIGTELTYQLHEQYSNIFEKMLADLEEQSEALDLQSYGISLTTLEEVFMRVGTEGDPSETNSNGTHSGMNGHAAEKEELLPEIQLLTGKELLLYQIEGLFRKKMLHTLRYWVLLLLQNLIPVTFLILTILVVRSWGGNKDLPELHLAPDKYSPTVSLLELNSSWPYDDFTNRIVLSYKGMFRDMPGSELAYPVPDMNKEYLNLAEKMITRVNTRYLFGASINQSRITAWFSNQPYHASPISLGMVHNATLRAMCEDKVCGIDLTNKPLPFRPETRFDMLQAGNNMGFQLAFNVGFAMAFVAAFYAIFYIKERMTKSKLLQFVSGVNIATYWTTAFIWDFVTFSLTAVIMLVTIALFQETGWSKFSELGRCYIVLACFIWAVIPFTYLFSMLFTVPATGFTRLSNIYIFTGVAVFTVVFTMSFDGFKLQNTAETMKKIFYVFPHFALSDALSSLNIMNTVIAVCDQRCAALPNCTMQELCEIPLLKKCCERNFYKWGAPGIGRNLGYMILTGIATFAILLLFEYRIFEMLLYKGMHLYKGPAIPESEDGFVDEDVKNEKNRIANMEPEEIVANNLVLRNMTKLYKKFLAVNQLCIGVNKNECFGLLGVNGAGKTSTFKMLTGDEKISYGDAWVQGMSLKTNMKDVYQKIGYCPQFDALIDDLTGRETMHMYALFRGIPKQRIHGFTMKIAGELNFTKHLDKLVKAYSGGNKRKLSTAVAMIGNPTVIYLDEPTTGMDPGAKRNLWNAVCKVRDQGKTIILTSHSMEECEALCTRLAIMVNGEFKCLGSSQHLKNKFSQGYVLTVKVGRKKDNQSVIISMETHETSDLIAIKSHIQQNFPLSTLKEEYQGLLTYQIANTNLKWSQMFGIMEKAKQNLNIEDYSIGQTSLEQVFLSFTKYQREDKLAN